MPGDAAQGRHDVDQDDGEQNVADGAGEHVPQRPEAGVEHHGRQDQPCQARGHGEEQLGAPRDKA